MDTDVRLKEAESEAHRNNLLCEALDIFVTEYNYITGELYIGSAKDRYIKIPWKKEDIVQKRFEDLVFRPDILKLKSFLDVHDITPENDKRNIRIRLFTDIHQYAWFRLSLICCFGQEGKKERMLIAFTNMDEIVEMEHRLKYYAERDFKTHLLHESAFAVRVKMLLGEFPDSDYQMVVMNIEHFHLITGMFGSKEGDNLLKYLAVKIQECMDDEERTAQCRIASDNFAMLVPSQRYPVPKVIDYLERAVYLYPNIYNLTLSFGVYPIAFGDRKMPVSQMIDKAMEASATVRDNYIQRVAYYDESMRRQEEREVRIINRMYAALEQELFLVYLQPRIELDTGRITGAEALVRWQYSEDEVKMPGEFIPIFEKNGFIIELDYYMIEHVCRIIRRWLDRGITALPVSVNLSRVNLYNPKLLDSIEACVVNYRIPRALIEFELTESSFSAENKHMIRLAESLRERGFQILIDDFGSGYSSLNALKEIPTDVLKIDNRFLAMEGDKMKANLVLEYIIKMAKAMELQIIVEGVEDSAQAEYLLGIGCQTAQGFYYYRPLTVEQYEESIRQKPISLSERKRADAGIVER